MSADISRSEVLSYSLSEIARWNLSSSKVAIPALQRGLVWKPNQVELLWDSILRGFPIGSFMLSDIAEDGQFAKYYLMDGQQRFNAISLGFYPDDSAMLWIDLDPPSMKNSTRRYWIKATTTPHPWGYKNDDECSKLTTAEKREALEIFGLHGNIYNQSFSLLETWPVEANCPYPLWLLLKEVSQNNPKVFLNDIKEVLGHTNFSFRNKIHFSEKICDYIENELFYAITSLKEYRINCNYLPKEVMEKETVADVQEQTTLEVLFTRLNTGGTQISKEDLNYSAIKAYWPEIKEENDNLAKEYMNPAKLAILAFRLALTSDEDKSLRAELSIKQIRSISKNALYKEKIDALYNKESRLRNILYKVDEWLGVNDKTDKRTPPVLRTTIAQNSPEIYLLLMYLAYVDSQTPISLKAQEIRALAFILHWFGNDKNKCVREIFKRFKEGININNIFRGLSQLMHDRHLLHIYSPVDVETFFKIGESPNWRVENAVPAPAREFFNRIFWNGNGESREMLLYAEREYINSHFNNYDPARQDMWAEENRPWDFDHIVARNRIERKQGEYREYDKNFLDCIGNFAAISFESNRSKSDMEDFSEYQSNKDALDYNSDIERLPYEITYDPMASYTFAQITYNRFCKIYSKIYAIIEPLMGETLLSEILVMRKNLFSSVKELYSEAIYHFVAFDENDYQLQREQDWTRDWIGVGIVKGEYMVCLEWQASNMNESMSNFEYGIRKAPGTSTTKEKFASLADKGVKVDDFNSWWYVSKEKTGSISLDFIKEQFDYYLSLIQ